jgi:hypothetical protein
MSSKEAPKAAKRSSALILRRLAARNPNVDTDSPPNTAPPPTYDAATRDGPQVVDAPPSFRDAQGAAGDDAAAANLTAAFENLNLSSLPADPTVDTCLAHLKLLFAIQWMKEDVGFTDGLFGLWDEMAGPVDPVFKARPEKEKGGAKEKSAAPEPSAEERLRNENLKTLSQIREKRWALFVARAADRYETWWKSLVRMSPTRPLVESDMSVAGFELYADFPNRVDTFSHMSEDMLPPLGEPILALVFSCPFNCQLLTASRDVLMVWHTHMLNPRAFLEDSILAGLRRNWAQGMPWTLVNHAIDTDFNYNVSDACKARWAHQTGLAWDNADDPMVKKTKCPRCNIPLQIPWTTCGLSADAPSGARPVDFTGSGYGDSQMSYECPGDNTIITKELLSVAKFVEDTKALIGPSSRPMPGTILDPQTGMPYQGPSSHALGARDLTEQTFPNRLLKSGCSEIRSRITGLMTPYTNVTLTMDKVRNEINTVLADRDNIRQIDSVPTYKTRYRLPRKSCIAVRKMMSRYWENFSLFALDLAGAVMRQGVFIEKMCKLDWLHSPSAKDTMARLLTKYHRFMAIMKAHPLQLAVPTLDVDLAWHTHQLSPGAYYRYTVDKTRRFVDHDDKIDDNTLSRQFEWTSKVYQDTYGEVYSECTCWYCEGNMAPAMKKPSSVLTSVE